MAIFEMNLCNIALQNVKNNYIVHFDFQGFIRNFSDFQDFAKNFNRKPPMSREIEILRFVLPRG